MDGVDPVIIVGTFLVLAAVSNIAMNIIRTVHQLKPKPSTDSSLQRISSRLDAMEDRQRQTEDRLSKHEDKISRQIGALHERINEVFGELREIKGSIKQHLKQGEQ